MTLTDIGHPEALELVRETLDPLRARLLPVWESVDHVLACDAIARVDSPSVSAAARDGYAVRSGDVQTATADDCVTLKVTGKATAGGARAASIGAGEAAEVMTGAAMPGGADAVVSVEYCRPATDRVAVCRDAEPGRNVIVRGVDVTTGHTVAVAGTSLTPAMTGLLAAGGLSDVSVHPRPRVAVVATGDEVVAPGGALRSGQLFASNMVTLQSWLGRFGMTSSSSVLPDDPRRLCEGIEKLLADADVVVTSGGAWKSAHDMSVEAIRELGFDVIFHRVRLAPGKAVALAVRGDKVAFCLPGGPPSNEMAFLQLALPGLLALAGNREPAFRTRSAVLASPVRKQRPDPTWTNFFQARLERNGDDLVAHVLRPPSRLEAQASAQALVVLPAGVPELHAGDRCQVQIL